MPSRVLSAYNRAWSLEVQLKPNRDDGGARGITPMVQSGVRRAELIGEVSGVPTRSPHFWPLDLRQARPQAPAHNQHGHGAGQLHALVVDDFAGVGLHACAG